MAKRIRKVFIKGLFDCEKVMKKEHESGYIFPVPKAAYAYIPSGFMPFVLSNFLMPNNSCRDTSNR